MTPIKIFSKGWNFSQDGPGNRLLYHFQGCNLFCPWCSNPEGIAIQGVLLVNPAKLLDVVCPKGAIRHKALDRNCCRTCIDRPCLHKHRNEGIQWSAKEYSIEILVEEIKNAKALFHSGGGVTITGGEPTLQFEPLKELLIKIKEMQINTVIETNGTSDRLPELFGLIDTLIIDFKHPDSSIHKKWLGMGNEKVMKNLEKSAASGMNLWIRIPLIPGFNDSPDVTHQFCNQLSALNLQQVSVEFLPYHEYGKIKWEQAGMKYNMPNRKIDAGIIKQLKEYFVKNHIKVINT